MGAISAGDVLAKGPVTQCLDMLSARSDSIERSRHLLAALRDLKPGRLVGVLDTHLFALHYDEARRAALRAYLSTCWFNREDGWWRRHQPLEPVYAEGLITALEASTDELIEVDEPNAAGTRFRAKPIDAYWIIEYNGFDLMTLASRRQVSLLILTPRPPEKRVAMRIWGEDAEVWTTGRRRVEDRDVLRSAGQFVRETREPRRTKWSIVTYKGKARTGE